MGSGRRKTSRRKTLKKYVEDNIQERDVETPWIAGLTERPVLTPEDSLHVEQTVTAGWNKKEQGVERKSHGG